MPKITCHFCRKAGRVTMAPRSRARSLALHVHWTRVSGAIVKRHACATCRGKYVRPSGHAFRQHVRIMLQRLIQQETSRN